MKILNEAKPSPLFFDQQTIGRRYLSAPASMLEHDSPSKLGILEARTNNIENVNSLATHQQNDTDREIGRLIAAHCCVPADDQAVARTRLGRCVVEFEPGPFDEIAVDGNRRLLILRSELHRSHRAFQVIEGSLVFPVR